MHTAHVRPEVGSVKEFLVPYEDVTPHCGVDDWMLSACSSKAVQILLAEV